MHRVAIVFVLQKFNFVRTLAGWYVSRMKHCRGLHHWNSAYFFFSNRPQRRKRAVKMAKMSLVQITDFKCYSLRINVKHFEKPTHRFVNIIKLTYCVFFVCIMFSLPDLVFLSNAGVFSSLVAFSTNLYLYLFIFLPSFGIVLFLLACFSYRNLRHVVGCESVLLWRMSYFWAMYVQGYWSENVTL